MYNYGMLSFRCRVEQMEIRPQTKVMDPMVCTTRDGVKNVFRDIQVISSVEKEKVIDLVRDYGIHMKNLLIYDRVVEAVQRFCANHSIDEVYKPILLFMKYHFGGTF